MKLVRQHIITNQDKNYKDLYDLCVKSKNLYNKALFNIRQHFFHAKEDPSIEYKYLNYYENYKLMHNDLDSPFFKLDQNTAQEVLKQADHNFKSFFASLKAKKSGNINHKVSIPHYKNKKTGVNLLVINRFSEVWLKKGYLKIPKTDIKIYLSEKINSLKNIKQFRIEPHFGYISINAVYEVEDKELKEDNKRYLGIDIGLNNLCTCASNVSNPFIINGRKCKAINQYYNKTKATYQSKLQKGKYTSRKIEKLNLRRKNQISDQMHKASKHIVDYAFKNQINTIIIGQNKEWKQNINIGKRNNQNFVSIPFATLINQIKYKAQLKGIRTLIQEESYTSKASFLDNDEIPVYKKEKENIQALKFSGTRTKRGLYKTKEGKKINADVNGALNIIRKALKVDSDALMARGISGLVFNPVFVNIA